MAAGGTRSQRGEGEEEGMTTHHTPDGSAPFHRLLSLSIVGGFLDGVRIDFAAGLNCIIGARGTGKTTVLEFVRYALQEMPGDPAACRRIESLVEKNLDGGRVRLAIRTKDGMTYVVSRSAGEESMVLTEDGRPTDITLKTGAFFRADIYSQNEVESIADRSLSQLDLIDSFEADGIVEVNRKIRGVKVELAANAGSMAPLNHRKASLEEELGALPGVEEKLKAFKGDGGEDSKEIDKALDLKALRDSERSFASSMSSLLEKVSGDLADDMGWFDLSPNSPDDQRMLSGPNGALLGEMFSRLRACGADVDRLLQEARARVEKERESHSQLAARLDAAHKEQELCFQELLERHKDAQGKATERSRLERLRNELKAKERQKAEAEQQLRDLLAKRSAMLQRLSELRDERFGIRRRIVDHINTNLSPVIRVSVEQDGNPEEYRALLERGLRDSGVRRNVVAQKIANALPPGDLVRVVKGRDTESLCRSAELNPDQANKVLVQLLGSDILFELETVDLVDLPRIELNDGGNYKETGSLSTGQKCTTILPILLLETEHPLLIDQPEDNLDNRFVFETIVDSLRKVKKKRQLVFITHNPNIPVLGDAERVVVLDSNGTRARKAKEGTVDECRDDIVMLLEGGEDAFKRRKERYSF